MLLDHQVQRIFHDLIIHEVAKINCEKGDIIVRIFDQASKISLSTLVYFGDHYIPPSVRRCVSQNRPLGAGLIKTSLVVDENHYQINLSYLGQIASLNHPKFKELVQTFSHIAEEWRIILDEHDRNDLVHVRVS